MLDKVFSETQLGDQSQSVMYHISHRKPADFNTPELVSFSNTNRKRERHRESYKCELGRQDGLAELY